MPKQPPFYVLIAISAFNIFIAYVFGNEGYEAFVTLAIALAALLSWQSVQLSRLLFRAKIWPIAKPLGLLLIVALWLAALAAILLAVTPDAHGTAAPHYDINWFIIVAGTVPYLLPRLNTYRMAAGADKLAIGALASFYSAAVLFIATLGFYDSTVASHGLLLVLAVQLQYLMHYAATQTNYIRTAYALAIRLVGLGRLNDSNIGSYLTFLIVGLPFLLPITLILAVILTG